MEISIACRPTACDPSRSCDPNSPPITRPYSPCAGRANSRDRTPAATMRLYLTQAHNDLMVAVGHDHSHTLYLASIYRHKVVMSAAELFSHRQPSNR
jgi:hypothetical protein